jgi:hypothetical protein
MPNNRLPDAEQFGIAPVVVVAMTWGFRFATPSIG